MMDHLLRCCPGGRRRHEQFAGVILLLLMISTSAWILSTSPFNPNSHDRASCRSSSSPGPTTVRRTRTTPFTAKRKDDDDNDDSETDDDQSGYSFFDRFVNKKEKKSEPKEARDEEESSSSYFGFFRSLSKKRESSKESKSTKNSALSDAQLAALLERESRISGMASFPNLNNSGFSAAFRNITANFNQVKADVLNIRPEKSALTKEQRRLAELRLRTENEKARRLAAKQREAEQQRAAAERRMKEKEMGTKKKLPDGSVADSSAVDGDQQSETRFNPLSVAQKYVFGFFESQNVKEEWIVVAPKTVIAPGQMVPVTTAGLDLLLVASKDGSSLYCTANSCPHLGTPLEVGILERRPIEGPEKISKRSNNTVGVAGGGKSDGSNLLQETDIATLLSQDGCEDCIVCPLHKTAFALASGEVRGEWCPYPPVIGAMMGTIKGKSSLPTFDVRTRGKNIEVRINSPLRESSEDESYAR